MAPRFWHSTSLPAWRRGSLRAWHLAFSTISAFQRSVEGQGCTATSSMAPLLQLVVEGWGAHVPSRKVAGQSGMCRSELGSGLRWG